MVGNSSSWTYPFRFLDYLGIWTLTTVEGKAFQKNIRSLLNLYRGGRSPPWFESELSTLNIQLSDYILFRHFSDLSSIPQLDTCPTCSATNSLVWLQTQKLKLFQSQWNTIMYQHQIKQATFLVSPRVIVNKQFRCHLASPTMSVSRQGP